MENERYLVRVEWVPNKVRVWRYTYFEAETLEDAKERAIKWRNKTAVVEVKFFKLTEVT